MHELSICESLLEILLAELAKIDPAPKKLICAHVAVGGLRQIVPEYLQGAYELLAKDTPAQGSELKIRQIPISAKCRDCSWAGEIQEMTFICSACNSTSLELTGGMELYLESFEIDA